MIGIATPAGAVPPPPPNPSDDQISASQDAANAAAAKVGQMSAQVAGTEGKIQQLQDDQELKSELAMKAQVDLQTAQAAAATAKAAATKAEQAAADASQAIDAAQTAAANFAAASFRQGSVLGSATALLDASSMDELLAREQMIEQVSTTQAGVIANLETARNNKTNLDSQARAAAAAAAAAQTKAEQAKTTADQAAAAAQQAFTQGQQQLANLQTQLQTEQTSYQTALNNVADLQGQRAQYELWSQQQQAQQSRLSQEDQQANDLASQVQQAQQQYNDAVAAQTSAKNAAVTAEKNKQAKIYAAAVAAAKKAAEERAAAAARAAKLRAELLAKQRAAAAAKAAQLKEQQAEAAKLLQQKQSGSSGSSGSSSTSGSSSGSGVTSVSTGNPPSNLSVGERVVQAALTQLGVPYAWGGGSDSGPTYGISYGSSTYGFDCSGLAMYAWAQVGVYLPHYSGYQYNSGRHVSVSNLQPGDLVFYAYNTSDPSTIHHVAIYMGNGEMIQAPETGSYVEVSPMRWSGYIGATRPGT